MVTGSMNIRGGGQVRPYRSPVAVWVWITFGTNCLVAIVFAALCSAVYTEFTTVVDVVFDRASNSTDGGMGDSSPGVSDLLSGITKDQWKSLFWGAAISAIFAFITVVAFHALALFLLICSCHSLGHPGRGWGRAFVTGTAFWTGWHILNIALQFASFEPVMDALDSDPYNAGFNRSMLTACVATGVISTVFYFLLGILMLFWREYPELLQIEETQRLSANV